MRNHAELILRGLFILIALFGVIYIISNVTYQAGYERGERDTWIKVHHIIRDGLRGDEEEEYEESLEGITSNTKYQYYGKRYIR
jgi:hypothetical protein